MTPTQERLPLDAPATRGRARTSGPRTSTDAARSMSGIILRAQQALVLEPTAARGSLGANAHEVQTWLADRGRSYPETNAIGTRFHELHERGLVRLAGDRPGRTGRPQHVFVATEAGRAVVAAWVAERGAR